MSEDLIAGLAFIGGTILCVVLGILHDAGIARQDACKTCPTCNAASEAGWRRGGEHVEALRRTPKS